MINECPSSHVKGLLLEVSKGRTAVLGPTLEPLDVILCRGGKRRRTACAVGAPHASVEPLLWG